MLSQPLSEALARLSAEFPTERVLMRDLDADAVFAVANDDLDDAIVRLFELAAADELGDRHAFELFDRLAAVDWQQWDMPAVQAISGWADAWWLTTLRSEADDATAGDVLGQLVHLGLPMVRWLGVWLEELDGPGAPHLADFIVDGSDHPGWDGHDDAYGQVMAWARSEAVVTGFTMIGGVHLEAGRMAEVYDRIIVEPGLHA